MYTGVIVIWSIAGFGGDFKSAAAQIDGACGTRAGAAEIGVQVVIHETTFATDLHQLGVFHDFEVVRDCHKFGVEQAGEVRNG